MQYKLVDKQTQKDIHPLDWLTTGLGIQCQVVDFLPPNLASDDGRVLVKYPDQDQPYPLAVPPTDIACEFVATVQLTLDQISWIRTIFDGMDDEPVIVDLLEKLR